MCISPRAALTAKPPPPILINTAFSEKQYHVTLRQSNENVERLLHQRRQSFLAQEPQFQHILNIDKIRCPLHILQFKRIFENLDINETLKLTSASSATINDLSAVCRILNISTQTLSYRRHYYLYASKLQDANSCFHRVLLQ
jgi:TusA-related sulfurtransferase